MRFTVLAFLLLLATAGCTKRDPVANGANQVIALPAPAQTTAPSPAGAPPQRQTAPATAASPAATIPAAIQGRWGLTPADCTSALGDAKGLLIVSSSELRFYESRAVPAADVHRDASTISGDFHFTGEGQSWTRFESLKVDRQKLVRTESNPPASFTYAKC